MSEKIIKKTLELARTQTIFSIYPIRIYPILYFNSFKNSVSMLLASFTNNASSF